MTEPKPSLPVGLLVSRVERGWPGHFICADRCNFRRNTLLHRPSDDTRIVISTVGSLRVNGSLEPVGYERYYETYIFMAAFESPYYEADVSRQLSSLEAPWQIGHCERDTDLEADAMHEANVAEVHARLASGETFSF